MKASEICEHAAELVAGDRAKTHGDKSRNHGNIAALFNAYLSIRNQPGSPLTGVDVAIMMTLLKVARTQLGATNADDFVDGCAYMAIAGELSDG